MLSHLRLPVNLAHPFRIDSIHGDYMLVILHYSSTMNPDNITIAPVTKAISCRYRLIVWLIVSLI